MKKIVEQIFSVEKNNVEKGKREGSYTVKKNDVTVPSEQTESFYTIKKEKKRGD